MSQQVFEEGRARGSVAQGSEAGGHRGIFLTEDVTTQAGTIALVPQVVDAVKVPSALAALPTRVAFWRLLLLEQLRCRSERPTCCARRAKISAVYREALKNATDNRTTLTNIFTGRPARGIVNRAIRELGPMSDSVPDFPLVAAALDRFAQKPRRQGRATSLPCGPAKRRVLLANFPQPN
jgi:nitronate monooxygenase